METRIKVILKEKGITQKKLASLLGIPSQSINDALSRNQFSISRLEDIASALGVEFYELFVDKNDILKQASEEEEKSDKFTCPHCGRPLKVKIE